MNPGIRFSKIWFDDDVVELKLDSFDGNSRFSNKVYASHKELRDLVAGLSTFKDQVHGGIYNIELGSFGPENARGGFRARLHFQERGKIYMTIEAQSDFAEFGIKNVASEATLYLRSESALLDNFIDELRALTAGSRDDANLQSVASEESDLSPKQRVDSRKRVAQTSVCAGTNAEGGDSSS